MSRLIRRNNKVFEDRVIGQMDRAREGQTGPKGSQFDEGVKKRLHDCMPGDWVKQVLSGAGNVGPLLRVVDPKAGLLENRMGVRTKLPPRAQVIVQP